MKRMLANVCPELINEWSQRNLPLTPESVTHGSGLQSIKWTEKSANTTELQNKLQKQNQLQTERKQKGVCPYCGNSFKGMFSKVCSQCGHPKD